MKLKTLVLVPVIAGAVIYAGLKGYIYFKMKENLDELSRMAAPFATMTYGDIGSDLLGKLTVGDVRVTPVGTTLSFKVDEIEIEGPDTEFLLALSSGFKDMDEPPRYGFIKFKRAELPSGDEVMSQMNQLSGLTVEKAKEIMPEECSLGGIFQHVGMDKIGFNKMLADFSLGYKMDQQSGEMELLTDYSVDGLEAFEMVMMLKDMPKLGSVMMGSMPSIGRMEASYRAEPAYMKGMVNYCSKQAGLSGQEYIQSMFEQPDAYYVKNLGFIPGDGIKQAMRLLLTNAGEMRFSAYPSTEINAQMLSAYKPQDLISLLGMQMSVNGNMISNMSFTVPDDPAAYFDELETGGSGEMTGQEQRIKLKPKRYIRTELSQLKNYLGEDIRITMKEDGRIKEGILDRIADDVVSVQQRIYGGKFTSHVQLSAIKKAEVMRRE